MSSRLFTALMNSGLQPRQKQFQSSKKIKQEKKHTKTHIYTYYIINSTLLTCYVSTLWSIKCFPISYFEFSTFLSETEKLRLRDG